MRAELRALVALSLLLGLSSIAPRARAYCRLTTSMATASGGCSTEGAPLYWPRACIGYSLVPRAHDDTPSLLELREVVDRSFASWTDVECAGTPVGLSLQQTSELSMCDRPAYEEGQPSANSIVFVDDWLARGLPSEAFGLTLVWHDEKTGEIFDADMQLNETLGPLTLCPNATCPEAAVDLQNIITHEAGHFLGLGHSAEKDACMYGKAEVGETSKRFLSLDDIDGLCAMYGELPEASCSPADYEPDDGFGPTCSDAGAGSPGPEPSVTDGVSTTCSVSAADGGGRGGLAAASLVAAALVLGRRRRRSR